MPFHFPGKCVFEVFVAYPDSVYSILPFHTPIFFMLTTKLRLSASFLYLRIIIVIAKTGVI